MREINIQEAHYISDYKVQLIFSDKKKKTIDFGKFLLSHDHPAFNKYRNIARFKKFKIEQGNIVWGKDWDIIFPLHDLYSGKLN